MRKEHLDQAIGQGSRRVDHQLLHIRGVGLQYGAEVALGPDHGVPGCSEPGAEQRQAFDPGRLLRC